MNIGIGNEHPDSLLTYPDVANLSGCAQPVRMRRQRTRAEPGLWQFDTYHTIPVKVT